MRTWPLLLLVLAIGFLIGRFIAQPVQAQQQPRYQIFGSDSSSNLPVAITTDGANALKVIGK